MRSTGPGPTNSARCEEETSFPEARSKSIFGAFIPDYRQGVEVNSLARWGWQAADLNGSAIPIPGPCKCQSDWSPPIPVLEPIYPARLSNRTARETPD